jgi:hypothetical protein
MRYTDFRSEQGEAWWARYKGCAEYIVWVTESIALIIDDTANIDRLMFRKKRSYIPCPLPSS